jgi:hypothetical protein
MPAENGQSEANTDIAKNVAFQTNFGLYEAVFLYFTCIGMSPCTWHIAATSRALL